MKAAKLGRLATHSPEAQARRSETQRRQNAARNSWNPSDKPDWLDEKFYRDRIQPRLRTIQVPKIQAALLISEPYALRIRAGSVCSTPETLVQSRKTRDTTSGERDPDIIGWMATGICTYCGGQRELTVNHVPPRGPFSKPRPSDLVTVLSCRERNAAFMKHDEYFRLAITTGIDKEKFPRELADSVKAINSLIRPESRGFARLMLQNYEFGPARLTVDKSRLEIVLYRIARGLFYHHKRVRMVGNIAFVFRVINERLMANLNVRERVDRMSETLTTIGPGTFRYAFEPFDQPDPFGIAWVMRFYDHRAFFCVTVSE